MYGNFGREVSENDVSRILARTYVASYEPMAKARAQGGSGKIKSHFTVKKDTLKCNNNMVPISLAAQPIVSQAVLSAGGAALSAGIGAAGAKGASAAAAAAAAATSIVLPASVAALRGGAGTAAATEAAAKAFDLTRARIRLEGLSAYGVSDQLLVRSTALWY